MMVVTVIKHSRVCHTVPLRSSYKQPGACRDLRVWRRWAVSDAVERACGSTLKCSETRS